MATYTNLGLSGAPSTSWFGLEPDAATFFSDTLAILPNLDIEGTFTRVVGIGMELAADGLTPVAGIVTSIERVGADGTVYETITGLNLPLTSFGTGTPFFEVVLAGNDSLAGAAGADTLTGLAGNDTLTGGAGNDVLIGGAGIDTAMFASTDGLGYTMSVNPDGSVTVTAVASGVLTEGTDQLFGIEQIGVGGVVYTLTTGTAGSDSVLGTAGPDIVLSLDGDDTVSGGSGNDLLDGGSGVDTLSFAPATSRVSIALATGSATGASSGVDQFQGFENVIGGSGSDIIIGDGGNNAIDGGGGHDQLTGGAGNDTLTGGTGFDIAIFSGLESDYTLSTSGPSPVLLDTREPAIDGADTLIGIEAIRFANSVLTIGTSAFSSSYIDLGQPGAPVAPWYQIDMDSSLPVASFTPTLFVIPNTDGTLTKIYGTGLALDPVEGNPISGTVTKIERTSGDGVTVYTSINGLNLPLVNFNADASFLSVVLAGNDIVFASATSGPLVGGGGGDTFVGIPGGSVVSYANAAQPAAGTGGVFADLGNSANNTTANNPAGNPQDAVGDSYIDISGLIGSSYDDNLRGSAGNNVLTGGDGNDVLRGRGGADTLDGGNGVDFADYSDETTAITVDLQTSSNNTGAAALDTFVSIEGIFGGTGDDILRGDNNVNFLRGGLGADTLDGGGGIDMADYRGAATGVTVDLANQANNTGEAAGDTFISIEAIRGSNQADLLRGDGANNILRGGQGADTLEGGAGIDTAEYTNASAGVTADLGNASNNTGEAAGDTYSSIEHLRGSFFADTLRGDAGANRLRGDTGNDTLDGGAGSDTAQFTGTQADYIITYNANGTITVQDTRVGLTTDGTDTLTNIEFAHFITGNTTVALTGPSNQPPTGIFLSANHVAENSAAGTFVGTLSASDPNPSDAFTYSINNAAQSPFEIVNGNQLVVRSGAAIDFEMQTFFDVNVTVDDGHGGQFTQNLTVLVDNVVELPTGVTLTGGTPIVEGVIPGSVLGTLTPVGGEFAGAYEWVLFSNPMGAFQVSGNLLSLSSLAAVLDYEQVPSYTIQLVAQTAGGLQQYSPLTLTLNVTDVSPEDNLGTPGNEYFVGGPGNDTFNGGGGTDTIVGGAGDDQINYGPTSAMGISSISAGEGADTFSDLTQQGSWTADLGAGDDTADVVAQGGVKTLTLGTGQDTLKLEPTPFPYSTSALLVTDIAAGAGGDVVDLSSYMGSGAPGAAIDNLRLVQDGADTVLRFIPPAGAPGAPGPEPYDIARFQNTTATAFTAENFIGSQPPVYTEPPANLPPTISVVPVSASLSDGTAYDPVAGLKIADIFVSDPDGGTVNLGVSGIDAALYEVRTAGGTHELYYHGVLDGQMSPTLNITVTADDPAIGAPEIPDATATLSLPVTHVNRAPTVTVPPPQSVMENTAPGFVITNLYAMDPDMGDMTFAFNLVDDAGGRFQIVNGNQLATGATPIDYEAVPGGTLNVTVTATDIHGATSAPQVLTIGVMDQPLEMFMGTPGPDVLTGGAGNDDFFPGFGADTIDGGGGYDRVWYGDTYDPMTIYLDGRPGVGGTADGDVLSNIERVEGGGGNDSIVGNDQANFIHGNPGDDTLVGAGGNDTFEGSYGNDVIDGGSGTDIAQVWTSGAAPVSVAPNASGGWTANKQVPGPGGTSLIDETQVLSNVEVVLATQNGTDTYKLLVGNGGFATAADAQAWAAANNVVTYEILTASTGPTPITGTPGNDTLTGTSGNDTILGLGADDSLMGGSGDDAITGGAGNDTIDGGDGIDTAVYLQAISGMEGEFGPVALNVDGSLTVNLMNPMIAGSDEGIDTLTGIERISLAGTTYDLVVGTYDPDNLTGAAGNDLMVGSYGADTFTGGAGNDILVGGAPFTMGVGQDDGDRAVYAGPLLDGNGYALEINADGTLTVDALGTTHPDEGIDTLIGIGKIDFGGTVYNLVLGRSSGDAIGWMDYLQGTSGLDLIIGGDGDDTIDGGAGNDAMGGGAGIDTLSFASITNLSSGVTVTLGDDGLGTATSSVSGSDIFGEFENVLGGSGQDNITGNSEANVLDGGIGHDRLVGGGGNDTLKGGDGYDRVVYSGNASDYTIGMAGGSITVQDNRAGSPDGTDVIEGTVEQIRFNDRVLGINAGGGFNVAYTNLGQPGAPATPWSQLAVDTNAGPLSASETEVVYANSDGSLLRITGFGFVFHPVSGEPTGGNIQMLERVSSDGTTVYESIVHVAMPLDMLFASEDGFRAIFAMNDILIGSSGNDTLTGSAGGDTYLGNSGFNVVSYENAPTTGAIFSGSTAGLVADLGQPFNNSGDAAGDTFFSINGLIGSGFDDNLRGNGTANLLFGGDGNDVLMGRAGADTLDGGNGFDFADYSNITLSGAAGGITADLQNEAVNTGDAAGDHYVSIEGLIGGAGHDTLRGDDNTNFLRGGQGTDILDGRGGIDYADYRAFVMPSGGMGPLVVDLANSSNNTYQATGDTFISIEGLRGSLVESDILRGDAGDNYLRGMGGADTLEGGAGSDWAEYANATMGVTADLGNEMLNMGEAAGDHYDSIENLRGSAFDDILRGDAGDNKLRGDSGSDTLEGGGGSDTAVYSGLQSSYQITYNADGSVTVQDSRAGSPDGTDTLTGIETIQFADGTVNLALNHAPVLGTIVSGVNEDQLLSLPATSGFGLLAPPLAQDADAGDTLVLAEINGIAVVFDGTGHASFTLASGAILTVATDGSYTYDQNGAFNTLAAGQSQLNADTFTFRVVDQSGAFSNLGTVAFNVFGVNDAPANVALTGATIAEASPFGTIVGTLSASDIDTGDTLTYTLLNDAGGRFAISGSTLVVENGVGLDYEQATSHTVTVRVEDGQGGIVEQTFDIAVTNVNEAPTDIVAASQTSGLQLDRLGSNSAVNSAANTLGGSALVALDDGRFLIAWVNASEQAVKGQLFDAAGTKVGTEFEIGPGSGGGYVDSLKLNNGNVLIFTEHEFALLDADANLISNEVPTLVNQSGYVHLAATAGGFVAAASVNGYVDIGIQGYDSAGQTVGPQFNVPSGTFNEFVVKDVVALGNGGPDYPDASVMS